MGAGTMRRPEIILAVTEHAHWFNLDEYLSMSVQAARLMPDGAARDDLDTKRRLG